MGQPSPKLAELSILSGGQQRNFAEGLRWRLFDIWVADIEAGPLAERSR